MPPSDVMTVARDWCPPSSMAASMAAWLSYTMFTGVRQSVGRIPRGLGLSD